MHTSTVISTVNEKVRFPVRLLPTNIFDQPAMVLTRGVSAATGNGNILTIGGGG